VSQPSDRPDRSTSQGYGADMARGMSQASRGLSVALGFVGVVLVFWLAGRQIDSWLDSEPWAQLVGAIVGWVLGIVTVYYMAQQKLR
jgi:F0F1-type ATP synthase assembly protein I